MPPLLDLIGDQPAGVDDGEMEVEVDRVHSPTTPHPGSIQPPLPAGEPKSLMRNKRLHDSSPPSSLALDPEASDDMDDAKPLEASAAGPADAQSAASESPSSSTESSREGGAPAEGRERGTLARARRARRRLQQDPGPAQEAPCSAPAPVAGPPPGLPPKMLAPPPPAGPPPSLPMGPGVKRRGVPNDPSELLAESLGCPLEELGKRHRRHSDTVEVDASSSSRSRGSRSESEDADASYNAAPPSARWVWDRLLKKHADADADADADSGAAALLERRALRGLEKLHAAA